MVAGDTADTLSTTLRVLDERFRSEYDWILMVDGNHEHTTRYPRLLRHATIARRVRAWNAADRRGARLVYLPTTTFRAGDVAFVGYCLWWDYAAGDRGSMARHARTYFDGWLDADGGVFVREVAARAAAEWSALRRRLAALEADPSVRTVVVVSHTVPHGDVLNWLSQDAATHVNAAASRALLGGARPFPKVRYWFSGHSHAAHDVVRAGVRLVANPRGRPLDHNRVRYARRQVRVE